MKNLLWLIVVIIAIALTLAVLVTVWAFQYDMAKTLNVDEKFLRLELLKMVWQFLWLIVLGSAVGLFFKMQEAEAAAQRKTQEKKQQEWATRREALLGTRSDLVKAYQETKAIRRLLRASALDGSIGQQVVRRDEYNSLMRRLIEAQLKFEYYLELVKSNRLLFLDDKELEAQLCKVEKYLNGVVKGFENAYTIFAGQNQAPLKSFATLQEFVQEKQEGEPFETKFQKPFHKALCRIEILADQEEMTKLK